MRTTTGSKASCGSRETSRSTASTSTARRTTRDRTSRAALCRIAASWRGCRYRYERSVLRRLRRALAEEVPNRYTMHRCETARHRHATSLAGDRAGQLPARPACLVRGQPAPAVRCTRSNRSSAVSRRCAACVASVHRICGCRYRYVELYPYLDSLWLGEECHYAQYVTRSNLPCIIGAS
jgi:hypothetical protein